MTKASPVSRRSYVGPSCPHCHQLLQHDRMVSGEQSCPYCRGEFAAEVFRPLEPTVRVTGVAEAGPTGSTACAKHDRNAAVAACGRCGQFICALCRIDADALTLCPPCFDRLSAEGALASAQTRLRDHAGSALTAAALGFVFVIPAGPILGPAAIGLGIRAILQKRALGESEGMLGAVVAILLGALELAGGIAFYAAVFSRSKW